MTTATAPVTTTRNDGSILVANYTWQCVWPVKVDGETFYRVGMADEAYTETMYFNELDTLDEAIEFIMGGQSDAEMEAAPLD